MGGIKYKDVSTQAPTNTLSIIEIHREKEEIGVMSQIPQMYLDNSSVAYLQDIDPFSNAIGLV